MLCFMWDTQHAVLFSQSLCMNASELKITLPWDPAIWEAPTAQEWHYQMTQSTNTPPPYYLTVLKSYTTPSSKTTNRALANTLQNLNALSRVLILHGLMSLAWDLNRRDQTSLGLSNLKSSAEITSEDTTSSNTTQSWQARISQSYDAWKSDFETYTTRVMQALNRQHNTSSNITTNQLLQRQERALKFQRFSVANMAIYHTAQMILAVDIVDLQIFAGAKHIIGRGVTDGDRERSARRIKTWLGLNTNNNTDKPLETNTIGFEDLLQTPQGRNEVLDKFKEEISKRREKEREVVKGKKRSAKAAWHAARLFRDGVTKLTDWDVDEMFHYPWCLYLAALMCFVLHEAASGKISPTHGETHTSTSSTQPPFTSARRGTTQHFNSNPHAGSSRAVRHPYTGEDDEADWDAKVEMDALISGLTKFGDGKSEFKESNGNWENEIWNVAGKIGTPGLLRCMVKQLNTVRWAVVREGMIVLRGLVDGS